VARLITHLTLACVLAVPIAAGQETSSNQNQEHESKRILGIIPNYRTSASLSAHEPLSVPEKFRVASEDAFDRGTFALAGLFAGEAQLTSANRSFNQGAAGFARYYSAAYGDLLIGDYMTEAVFPALLHQGPRYFRRGAGTARSRFAYAVGQIFWTHNDAGGTQFNYSEIIGNSTAVAISNAYYSDNRDVGDAVSKLGVQLGVDIAGNILKEFWPDLLRKFGHKHHGDTNAIKSTSVQ
jgi:hypothetical protein